MDVRDSFLNALALIEAVLQEPDELAERVRALTPEYDAQTLEGAQAALAEMNDSLESVLALWISAAEVGDFDVAGFVQEMRTRILKTI